jgi:hypothetical protein
LEFSLIYNSIQTATDISEVEALFSLLRHNEVITPTLFLCLKESLSFLYELQSSIYSGAARTLRCILETAIEACEFQSQKHRPKLMEIIEGFPPDKMKELKEEEKIRELRSLLGKYNAWISFKESYVIHEQTKRIAPSFVERVNRLKKREFFSDSPKISDDIKTTYETLCDYVHPSSERIEHHMENYGTFVPRLNSEDFAKINELSLKTFDIVQFIYIKAMAHFLGFEDAKKFLEELWMSIETPKKIPASFLKHPHVSKLSQNIIWEDDQTKLD